MLFGWLYLGVFDVVEIDQDFLVVEYCQWMIWQDLVWCEELLCYCVGVVGFGCQQVFDCELGVVVEFSQCVVGQFQCCDVWVVCVVVGLQFV